MISIVGFASDFVSAHLNFKCLQQKNARLRETLTTTYAGQVFFFSRAWLAKKALVVQVTQIELAGEKKNFV